MNFLKQAENIRSVKGSDRVLACEQTGEEYPIADVAKALAEKFDLKPRAVVLKLNHAVRNNKSAFNLKWTLASGTPYGEVKPRGPRKTTGEKVTPIKRKKSA